MKILVTGATGFLGHAVTRALLSRGMQVVAVGRDKGKCRQLSTEGATALCRDLSTPFTASEIDAFLDISGIVHCAALSAPCGPRHAFQTSNVAATRNMVDLALAAGVKRFVYISTPAVYFRLADQFALHEAVSLPRPLTIYAATKRAGEEIVLGAPQTGPIVVRPRGIYGKGDSALLPRLVRAARSGPLPLLRDGTAQTDITHIDDAVAAILAALDAPTSAHGHVFNVSGGTALSIRHIAESACARLSITPRWRAMPLRPLLAFARLSEAAARLSPRPMEPRLTLYGLGLLAYSQTLDIAKADRMLSWRPRVPFEEGLMRTFAP